MNRTIGFFQELFSTSSQDKGGSLGSGAFRKHIITLGTHLNLLKLTTSTQNRSINIIYSGLNSGSSCLLDSLDIVISNTAGTEHATVSKVLSSQIADRQAR